MWGRPVSNERFAEVFKQEAVRQVIERGYTVAGVAKRLGVSVQSLYKWVKAYSPNATDRYETEIKEVWRENPKLKAELRRAQEERGILKKAAAYFTKNPEWSTAPFCSIRIGIRCNPCVVCWVFRAVVRAQHEPPW